MDLIFKTLLLLSFLIVPCSAVSAAEVSGKELKADKNNEITKDNVAELDLASFVEKAKGKPGLILTYVNAKIEDNDILALLTLIDLPYSFYQRVPRARQLLNPSLKKAIQFVANDRSDIWRWHKLSTVLLFREKSGKILPYIFAETLYYLALIEVEMEENTLEEALKNNISHLNAYPEIVAKLLDAPEVFFASDTAVEIFLNLLANSKDEKIQNFALDFYGRQKLGVRLMSLVSKRLTLHYLKKTGVSKYQCDLFLGVSRHFHKAAVGESVLKNTMYGSGSY